MSRKAPSIKWYNQGMRSPEQSSSQSEPSPFGDLDAYNEFVKQQQEQKDAQKQADAEKGIVERQVLQQGDRSTFSRLKMENGEEHFEIDSVYQDNATEFKQQHPDIKNDFHLNLSIGCLAVDLASLDATHYSCYNQGDEKTRAAFLKNYRLLRERLDNESTPTDERELISSYLRLQNGEQLTFLQNEYDDTLAAEAKSEKNDDELAQMREEIEQARTKLEETDKEVEKLLGQIDFIRGERNVDYEELHQAVTNLIRTIEDAATDAKHFKTANETFITALTNNKNLFSQETIDDSKKYYDENDQTITRKFKELDELGQKYSQYQKAIAEILSRYA